MAQGLTARQRSVLLRIGEGIHLHGYPPTFREIGKAENIHSTNGVRSILEALEKKGYIRRLRYRSRAIELTPRGKEVILESHIGERTGERSLSSGHLVELSDMVMPTSSVVEIPVIGRVAAGQPILAEENIEGHIAIDADFAPGGETFALRVKGRSMVDAGIHDGDVVF
ncbi:MAG TPA: repressor LexA, partial [Bacteroidetes bacterium]|nr:repressor LexA [Bacteroidota bacterium]